eukprot:CAMPEP_0179187324 /NCGR_PEP_ID=MMETSP0796-20121207/92951_1 /TAXON_ID=73915 /ORGANISM="Pyrodinium bahamense, Strain pbaha01" /LENGTH=641 /DNA_ID=CAMNT_0020891391 /DNA_START=77 /DNA_END=2002 /DNA_ORIENTATION=+
MVHIQLDVNALPVAVGAVAYILWLALSKLIARWALGTDKQRLLGLQKKGDPDAVACAADDADIGPHESSEPVPEPAPERPAEKPPAVCSSRAAHLGSTTGAVVVAGVGFVLLLLLVWATGTRGPAGAAPSSDVDVPKQVPTATLPPLATAAHGSAAGPVAPAPPSPGTDADSAAEGVVAVAPAEAEQAGEAASQELVTTSAPLMVKLTRQAMDNDQHDYIRSAYYGTLMVGNPPVPFSVVFDTGSGHLVLPSTYCSSSTCRAHRRYSRRKSSTGVDVNYDGQKVNPTDPRDQIAVSFGTGEVTGVLVEDVICVDKPKAAEDNTSLAVAGSAQGLEDGCVTLRLIAATSLSEDPFAEFQFDGVLGLGLEGLSQAPEFNFMGVIAKSLQQSGNGMSSTFGVFLADNAEEDSEIALGGWAEGHLAEDLSWGPVHDPEMGHWIVPVRGIRVNNQPLDFCEDGGCTAAVDTGTSLLAVPTAAFSSLYQGLRHPAPKAGHCQGRGPLLHIELDHFTVTMGPRDYARLGQAKVPSGNRLYNDGTTTQTRTQRMRQDLRCIPMLMTLDLPEPLGPKLFILGEPVLRKYYTVFDAHRKRVGFGRARHQQDPSREDLLMMAPELDRSARPLRGARRSPTMFDFFRWRKALR